MMTHGTAKPGQRITQKPSTASTVNDRVAGDPPGYAQPPLAVQQEEKMKRHLRAAEGVFIITILITFLVCSGLYAAEEILPTPEEIIAKYFEAMGGKEAREKIYNRKIVRILKYVQVNKYEIVTSYQERPDKEYALCEADKDILRFGSNGKIAWTIHPQNGARLFEGVELSSRLLAAKFDQPDVPYKSMKTEGIEQINGKDCYKVV